MNYCLQSNLAHIRVHALINRTWHDLARSQVAEAGHSVRMLPFPHMLLLNGAACRTAVSLPLRSTATAWLCCRISDSFALVLVVSGNESGRVHH